MYNTFIDKTPWCIAGRFFYRDWYVYQREYIKYLINYGFIYASLFSLTFGLILPTLGLGSHDPCISTSIMCGQALWIILPITFHASTRILLDLLHNKFISYQLILTPAPILLMEKIIFHSIVACINVVPFFIIAKLILGAQLLIPLERLPLLILVIIASSCMCSAYSMAATGYIRSPLYSTNFFVRISLPLVTLGGLFVPWHTIYRAYPLLGICIRITPFIYISEGLRGALLPTHESIPLAECIVLLLCYSILFFITTCYLFKKKLDHV